MPENKTKEETIVAFVDQMLAEAQIAGMSPEEQTALKAQLEDGADDVVEMALIEALPDEKLIELNELLDNNAPDEDLDGFFASAGVDFAEVVGNALLKYRQDFLANLAQTPESEA